MREPTGSAAAPGLGKRQRVFYNGRYADAVTLTLE
jgi:hypothetical protein